MNWGPLHILPFCEGKRSFTFAAPTHIKKDNHFPYRTIIGETAPLYCTSLGKVMMAFYAFGRTGGLSYAISFLSHLYTIYHNRAGPAETGSRLDSRKRL